MRTLQGRPSGMVSPATGQHELVEIEVGGVKLDVCPATGGIWFDRFELDRFDEAHEAQAELLELPYDPSIVVDTTQRRRSPKAPEVVMMRQGFGADREIEIDVCPATGGIWLDRGELERIHALYPTAEDRKRAASRVAVAALSQRVAEQRVTEREDGMQTGLRGLASILQWLSPSYYRRHRDD